MHCEPLHHSLSHTVYPKTHQVEPLLDAIEQSLTGLPVVHSQYGWELEVYFNDTRTRFFLCVNCTPASNAALARMSTAVDSCLESFALQTFYTVPTPPLLLIGQPN